MKGEKVVTTLIPYGAERPRTGMLKSVDTDQAEIFWDPPRGDFTKYVLNIDKIDSVLEESLRINRQDSETRDFSDSRIKVVYRFVADNLTI